MIRPSLLDVSFYCPRAHQLSAEHGAGRAALMGQVFHSCCASMHGTKTEKKATEELFVRLTDEEAAEISQWKTPVSVEFFGSRLTYDTAEKELEVGLTPKGGYTASPAQALTHGTLDMAWTTENKGQKVAIIGDIKKSRWTVSGPDTLQLWAYGLAYAAKNKCNSLICGIWAATEGEWWWSKRYDLTWDFDTLFSKVKAAATNTTGQACTGPHCGNLCYARFYCPEHCLPNSSSLAIPPEGEMTDEKMKNLLTAVQSIETQHKMAKDACKEWARRNGGIRHGNKVYKKITTRGRPRVMKVADVRKILGDDAEKVIISGEPIPQFRWVNDG